MAEVPLNQAVSRVPVETWEEIIALAVYDPSPFDLVDQWAYIHSRRARKRLRLGQQDFRTRISKLSCVCRSWRDLTARLVDQFLEIRTHDELTRLRSARSGHGCVERRRLDLYSCSWNFRASHDSVLRDCRAILSRTRKLDVLSLVRMGVLAAPDKFLLGISDLLSGLKALEYVAATGRGVDGEKVSALAMGYRSLQYLSCDITVLSDAFSNTPVPTFPHLRTLRTFVHAPPRLPDGFEEWLANWETPALKNLSLTHPLGYDDWKWLCALLKKNGRTLESIQFSVNSVTSFREM